MIMCIEVHIENFDLFDVQIPKAKSNIEITTGKTAKVVLYKKFESNALKKDLEVKQFDKKEGLLS